MRARLALDALRRQLSLSAAERAAPLVLALLPAFWLSLPLLKKTPLSYDHATHLFKAWHFWEEMLGRWRLRGWSHFWAFGFPSDELVPMGGEVWVALFRVVTFGQLSWLGTYSLAFAGFLIFKTLAAFYFTRNYLGAGAAVVCAWITVLDPGGMLEGGWDWHTYWGVWPVTLAMSFALFAISRLEKVLRAGQPGDVFWAGVFFGAALLTHQMVLPALAIIFPLLLVDHAARPRGLSGVHAGRAVGALAFGVALSAFFLVPFMARSQHTQDLGWLGDSLPVVSQKLLELRLFQNVSVAVHGLALLGAWFALRRRVPGALLLVLSGAVLVLLASGTLIRDLHLERVLPSLIKIEANRFLLVAKLFWFPLAGYALVQLFQPLVQAWGAANPLRRTLSLGLGGVLALALFAPGWRSFHDTQVAKTIVGQRERQWWHDFPKVWDWTRELRQSTDEHYRIAYHLWRGEHLSTLSPVFDQTLMYKLGSTPTQIFDKVPMTDEPEVLQALSVKYVVSAYPLGSPRLTEERQFGDLRLYRFLDYRAEPFTVLGAGHGELLEFSPERIRIQLRGTAPDSRLKIHVATFDRWQATISGAEVPIVTAPVYGAEYPILMEVPARDGELTLRYVYRTVDWLGLILTLCAVPAFVAVAWLDRRHQLLARLVEALRRGARPLGWGAFGSAALILLAVAVGTRSRAKLLPPQSIFHRVEGPLDLTLDERPCEELAPLSFRCGSERVNADVVEGVWGLHLCMTAPAAEGLKLRVKTVLGSFLSGHYDPQVEEPGRIQVKVNGEELGNLSTRPAYLRHQRIQFDTRAHRGEEATVEVSLTGTALRCFDLRTVP